MGCGIDVAACHGDHGRRELVERQQLALVDDEHVSAAGPDDCARHHRDVE
jgi:hypothetical protein